ncbi:MAG: PilZ domain-containing protein [Desulfobulbaceae bacterium]|nr:PilZ domain-containing protein [Desulfobulbaceae bacterium]
MASKQGSTVRADIKKNRLCITIASKVNKKELDKIYTDVRFCVADLKSGFDVVTDLSQCTIGHLNSIPTLRKIMAYLTAREPGEVVRIIGKTSLIFKQLLGFTSRFHSYKPIYVSSLEEAEEKLDHATRRNGLRFSINSHEVEYTFDQEQGKGYLFDISTSGCAVQEPTIPVPIDTEITLTLPFNQDSETVSSFTFTAKTIRTEENLFAVQFIDFDDDQKAQFYKCLAFEMQRDLR